MGNAFVHDGIYGINDLIVCELREHKLYIPYYTDEKDDKLKWFPMGVEIINENIDENGYKYKTITCRYITERIKNVVCKKNYFSSDDHVVFTKSRTLGYIMELDKMFFTKTPFKYPNKKFKKYYVSKDVVNDSIMAKVKHNCFTLCMYISQKTVDYDKYDEENLYRLMDIDSGIK